MSLYCHHMYYSFTTKHSKLNVTSEVFVLPDGELDDIVGVLQYAGTVFKCTVVESHVVNGQQLISWLN